MAFHADTRRRERPAKGGTWEFYVVYATIFLFNTLPAAMFSRLFARALNDGAAGERLTIFGDAKARADEIVPFLFMG